MMEGPSGFSLYPQQQATAEFLSAASTDHKSITSVTLLFIHAHLDKVTDAREKGKLSKGFGRT